MVEHFYLVPSAQPSAVALQLCLLGSSGPHSSVLVEGKTFSNSVLWLGWATAVEWKLLCVQQCSTAKISVFFSGLNSTVLGSAHLSSTQLHCASSAHFCSTQLSSTVLAQLSSLQFNSTPLHHTGAKWDEQHTTQPSPAAQNRKILSLS